MLIHTIINERTLRRTFAKDLKGRRALTVFDRSLHGFGLRVSVDGTKTFFVRTPKGSGMSDMIIGRADEITAAAARERALALLRAAEEQREQESLFRNFADEFMRRQERRWKPATRKSNRAALDLYILPFFGGMRLAEIADTDVQRWFDSMSGIPGAANRSLPVLSVMMTQAELWDLRPQGSNPCRKMRRYRMPPRERFLSLDELKRLGTALDRAESANPQAVAAIRLLLFTGARSSEITGLKWDWIRDTRAILPDSKTGPKTIQLPLPARAVLNDLPRTGEFVLPNQRSGPMRDLGLHWTALRELADLPDVRLHDLRHTYASHAVMSGLDLYTVGRLLGHADTGSTERYAHLANQHVLNAAKRISGIVNEALTDPGKETNHDRQKPKAAAESPHSRRRPPQGN